MNEQLWTYILRLAGANCDCMWLVKDGHEFLNYTSFLETVQDVPSFWIQASLWLPWPTEHSVNILFWFHIWPKEDRRVPSSFLGALCHSVRSVTIWRDRTPVGRAWDYNSEGTGVTLHSPSCLCQGNRHVDESILDAPNQTSGRLNTTKWPQLMPHGAEK